MESVTPVVPGLEPYEIKFGGKDANQPEYTTLHSLRSSKATGYKVMSRWVLSDDERMAIAAGADLYLSQLTFGHEYQPIMPVIQFANACADQKDDIKEIFQLDEELNERILNL